MEDWVVARHCSRMSATATANRYRYPPWDIRPIEREVGNGCQMLATDWQTG